jgi:hypothetical protein
MRVMWPATQHAFASALLDPQRPVPATLRSHTSRAPAKRFAVYRNNVIFGLIGALRARFPVVERIVGEECFAAMAQDFAVTHPPRSPLLIFYGDGLPDFIAELDFLAEVPYLADVARLEAARTHAYHAADAIPVGPAALQGLRADQLLAARAILHPSTHIIRSRHPIVTIWAMNSGEAELRSIEEEEPENALVVRPHGVVTVRKLPTGGAALLQALAAGEGLGRAAESAMQDQPCLNLAAHLAGLIESGAITALSIQHSNRANRDG